MDHNILVALIKAVSVIVAAAVPSIITYIVSNRFFRKRDYDKLEKNHLRALKDIEFLLDVERLHCRRNVEMLDKSYRTTTRKEVSFETELTWSGQYSQKRVYLERLKLEGKINES